MRSKHARGAGKSKKKKGVSLIFEQVMLFFIGVVIFIICFAIFNIYQVHYTELTTAEQLGEVNDWVSSTIVEFATMDQMTNSSLIVEIPRRIGNEIYEIELTTAGLSVFTSDGKHSTFSNLFNLNESYDFSGKVVSTRGRFIIYKKQNQIILG